MPITTYADLVQFKHWLESDPDDPQNFLDDDLLTWCLEAATEDFELATNRVFYASDDDAERTYGSLDGRSLIIHDLTAIAELATDTDGDGIFETVWTADQYLLVRDDGAQQSEPYTSIRALGVPDFPTTYAGTRVTGMFGYTVDGEAPAGVKPAVMVGANRWLHRRGTPLGTETTMDAGGTMTSKTIRGDYDYQKAIERYARAGTGYGVVATVPVIVPTRPTMFTLAPGYRGRSHLWR